jgi:hypothetical protein
MSTLKVFIDTSGSTGGRYPYWNYVRTLVSQSRFKDAKFYTYDSSARQVSLGVILAIAQQLGDGDRGTYTSTIAKLVQKDDSLVIVTDGQVEPEEVKRCDTLLQNMAFKSVEVHFQYTCGDMDLSVSAPFTRNAPACRLLINGVEAASIRKHHREDRPRALLQ